MAPLFFAVKICHAAWASGELAGAGMVALPLPAHRDRRVGLTVGAPPRPMQG
jgi:hypothetical protein